MLCRMRKAASNNPGRTRWSQALVEAALPAGALPTRLASRP